MSEIIDLCPDHPSRRETPNEPTVIRVVLADPPPPAEPGLIAVALSVAVWTVFFTIVISLVVF